MTNPTMKKFGYPDTLIHDYPHWVVLLRNDQITLGSLVVAEKSPATSLSAVEPRALAELASIAGDVETAFARTFQPDKFNYLMLMMVDPNVHFHVLPRYSDARECAGVTFEDSSMAEGTEHWQCDTDDPCATRSHSRLAARRLAELTANAAVVLRNTPRTQANPRCRSYGAGIDIPSTSRPGSGRFQSPQIEALLGQHAGDDV